LASAVWSAAVGRGELIVAVLVAVMSAAIAFESFRPDSPRATAGASWHDALHNAVFPAIPIAGLAAAAVAVFTGRRAERPYISASASGVLLGAMIAGLALTRLDSIAQLARYFFFGALLVWIE